jgi:hypothetical protein
MFKRIFRKRFKIGDTVRLIRTGQKAVIIDKGALPVARKEITTFVEVRKRHCLRGSAARGYRAGSVTGFRAAC